MSNEIISYYDRLAGAYDVDRFGNSYGKFVHAQEVRILDRWLPRNAGTILDIGCGTGRLTEYATFGCDASISSVRLAVSKRPARGFVAADLTRLPFASASFDAAICFHVFMHLDRRAIERGLHQIAEVLKPGGILVADVASGVRRRLLGTSAKGWHGSTSFSVLEFSTLAAAAGLRMSGASGTIMSPVHRLPAAMRPWLARLDGFAAERFPDFASYVVGAFVKDGA